MAGDWIKMRTSLLTNPKVGEIAKILESSPQVGRALCLDHNGPMSQIVTRDVMRHVTVSSLIVIWTAANEHTRDGVLTPYELSDFDLLTRIPGFGAAMEAVGWATYDEENRSVTLPNFNEYNTSSSERSAGAKTGAQRQKEYRDRKTLRNSDVTGDVTNDVTSNRREEKRRNTTEDKSSVVRAAKKCPPDFSITTELRAWGAENCPLVDLDFETAKFHDCTFKTARSDWPGTWRNWMRKAQQDASERPPHVVPTYRERDAEHAAQRAAELAPGVARRTPNKFITQEAGNVTTIANH